ncbi:MAG: PDZ domain-containing protein [bacterium]
MRIYSYISRTAVLLATASALQAQGWQSCLARTPAAIGINSFQCANCEFNTTSDGTIPYTFSTEPVVLKVGSGSALIAGDIVEAINGHPITTITGAAQFVHPPTGKNDLTVRRGRDRRVFTVSLSGADCAREPRSASTDSATVADLRRAITSPDSAKVNSMLAEMRRLLGRLDSQTTLRRRVVGSVTPGRTPLYVIDGITMDGAAAMAGFGSNGGFGFAVACNPSCHAATGKEGTTSFTYYRYTEPPPIIAVRPGGPADRAGIKVGDVVTKVDGMSILEDAGALRLWSVHHRDNILLTVLRDGKEVGYPIKEP